MHSLEELIKQREELELKIKNTRDLERSRAIDDIKRQVKLYAISPYDIFSDISVKVEAKYKNPLTGETWSGRGKTPKWLEGKNRSDFEIK
jgi:DNA-binding protein H-NS